VTSQSDTTTQILKIQLTTKSNQRKMNKEDYLETQAYRIQSISDPVTLDNLTKLGAFYGGMESIEKVQHDIKVHGRRFLCMVELLDMFKPKPISTVLEIGCNTGLMSTFIKDRHPEWNVIGVDLAPRQIEANKLINSAFPFPAHFLTMDGGALTLDEEQFDVVMLCEILEHLEEDSELQHRVLSEALSVTREGGIVVVSVPYEDRIPSPGHLTEFTSESMTRLLRSEAAHVVELEWARHKFDLEHHLIFLASNSPIPPSIYQ